MYSAPFHLITLTLSLWKERALFLEEKLIKSIIRFAEET